MSCHGNTLATLECLVNSQVVVLFNAAQVAIVVSCDKAVLDGEMQGMLDGLFTQAGAAIHARAAAAFAAVDELVHGDVFLLTIEAPGVAEDVEDNLNFRRVFEMGKLVDELVGHGGKVAGGRVEIGLVACSG